MLSQGCFLSRVLYLSNFKQRIIKCLQSDFKNKSVTLGHITNSNVRETTYKSLQQSQCYPGLLGRGWVVQSDATLACQFCSWGPGPRHSSPSKKGSEIPFQVAAGDREFCAQSSCTECGTQGCSCTSRWQSSGGSQLSPNPMIHFSPSTVNCFLTGVRLQGTNTQCSKRAGVLPKATQLRRTICRREARNCMIPTACVRSSGR